MKKQINQLKAGAMLSYVNLALSSLIPFFYTPVMLRMLGEAEYGLYSLSSSVISYLSLLTFGFGSTIVRYITMYRASNEKEKEEKVFGFFLILYCGIALIVLICGFAIARNVESIFHKGLLPKELAKMYVLILIMAFNSALSFPISVFSSVIMSHEKYIFRRLVDMFSTVIAPIGNLVALYLGYTSVGMAVSSTIIQFIMLPINVIYCLKVLKIHPKLSILPKQMIKEMLGFSVFIFIGTIVDMLFWSTDKVILGMMASSTAVAVYNIGGTFNGMVTSLSTSISGVLTPRITTMIVQEAKKTELTDLFIRVGRMQYLVVALVISGFAVFGQDFLVLWAGEKFLKSYWIAILTLFPLCIPLIQNTGVSIVVAQNKHQFRSIVYLIIAIINVISTYFVVPYLGEVGAALCSGVSYIVGQGIIMNAYYYKITGIDIPLFWKNIFQMSKIPAAMFLTGMIINCYINFKSWITFFVAIVVYTICYLVLMYRFGLNECERNVLIGSISKIKLKMRTKRN